MLHVEKLMSPDTFFISTRYSSQNIMHSTSTHQHLTFMKEETEWAEGREG
jgi:hypothetical protein